MHSCVSTGRDSPIHLTESLSPKRGRHCGIEGELNGGERKRERFCGLAQNRAFMMGLGAYLRARDLVEGGGVLGRVR